MPFSMSTEMICATAGSASSQPIVSSEVGQCQREVRVDEGSDHGEAAGPQSAERRQPDVAVPDQVAASAAGGCDRGVYGGLHRDAEDSVPVEAAGRGVLEALSVHHAGPDDHKASSGDCSRRMGSGCTVARS